MLDLPDEALEEIADVIERYTQIELVTDGHGMRIEIAPKTRTRLKLVGGTDAREARTEARARRTAR